ncbi:MAG: NUDIX domain-containing protein [Nanoarchaeota archaeon]|nr:NUDIX domain-containing protein [Nanoarchaeota archaeon]
MGEINWKDKCFVATIYLVNSDNKVLLSWNKNMQAWIPVGGHVDPGETPEEAITREVKEETGFDFEFFQKEKRENTSNTHYVRSHLLQIDTVPHHNKHINFVFIGKCKNDYSKLETDEQEKLKWFTHQELIQEKGKMIESVRVIALEALDLVK